MAPQVSLLPDPPLDGVGLASGFGIVDCWIGIDQDGDRRVLRLAGRLDAAQVPELLLACTPVGPLLVDLTELVSIDAAGVEALQRVRARGAILKGVPGYIRLKLDSRPKEDQRAKRTRPLAPTTPSFFIRNRKVLGWRPRRSAAFRAPLIRPPHSCRMASMCAR
jgi:hypothetical protein